VASRNSVLLEIRKIVRVIRSTEQARRFTEIKFPHSEWRRGSADWRTYNDGFQAPANESALFRNLATMGKAGGGES